MEEDSLSEIIRFGLFFFFSFHPVSGDFGSALAFEKVINKVCELGQLPPSRPFLDKQAGWAAFFFRKFREPGGLGSWSDPSLRRCVFPRHGRARFLKRECASLYELRYAAAARPRGDSVFILSAGELFVSAFRPGPREDISSGVAGSLSRSQRQRVFYVGRRTITLASEQGLFLS